MRPWQHVENKERSRGCLETNSYIKYLKIQNIKIQNVKYKNHRILDQKCIIQGQSAFSNRKQGFFCRKFDDLIKEFISTQLWLLSFP